MTEDVIDEYRCVAVLSSLNCAMLTIREDRTIVLETGSDWAWAVAFHPDGKHLLGGGADGIRRWHLPDGQEVGKQTGMNLNAISVSRDGKWVVCGTTKGASVWDAELDEEVIDVEGGNRVYAIDVSPDSTRFATGTVSEDASIWDIASGERLVGPLKYGGHAVTGVRFSPSGEHIAASCLGGLVRIHDSRNGSQLIDIDTTTRRELAVTPLVWSNDAQRIFTASQDNRIKCFAISTGSQLAASPILNGSDSISLADNNKFIATVTSDAISFLDASTLAKVGTAIEGEWSSGISLHHSRIAAGRRDGKIIIHGLPNFLPDLYGPFRVSNCLFIMLACRITTISCIRHRPRRNDQPMRNLWPPVATTINHLALNQ